MNVKIDLAFLCPGNINFRRGKQEIKEQKEEINTRAQKRLQEQKL